MLKICQVALKIPVFCPNLSICTSILFCPISPLPLIKYEVFILVVSWSYLLSEPHDFLKVSALFLKTIVSSKK